MRTKRFDCVEARHRGAAIVQAEIAGMTREQEVAFWREQTARWREELRVARERRARAGVSAREAVQRILRRAAAEFPAKAKAFDCVEMMHEAQAKTQTETARMTPEEPAAFRRAKATRAASS